MAVAGADGFFVLGSIHEQHLEGAKGRATTPPA